MFLSGFAMFGAIIFVPLFFQGVLGASATNSGSFLTPMMLGVVAGAVLSGQALSRLGGHYRLQGLLGLGLMGAGIFMLSRMSPDTSFGSAVGNIVLMGVGLGITFPPYTIAVQNAVPYQVLGIATSSVQFFRSIGGTLGLAILGSLMTNRFASGLAGAVSPEVNSIIPTGRIGELTDNPYALLSPDAKDQLEAVFLEASPQATGMFAQFIDALRHALSSAISDAFLIILIVIAGAWVATLWLKAPRLTKETRPLETVEPAIAPGKSVGDN